MTGKHALTTPTPVEGVRHELPVEAVDTYEGIWLRIQMAGIELGHGARLTRRLSWAITTVTAVTSLAVFTTLSLATGMAARVTVGVVVAAAAVLLRLGDEGVRGGPDGGQGPQLTLSEVPALEAPARPRPDRVPVERHAHRPGPAEQGPGRRWTTTRCPVPRSTRRSTG